MTVTMLYPKPCYNEVCYKGTALCFSTAGDLKFWDPRFTESVRSLSLQQDFTCVDIHPRADVLAW